MISSKEDSESHAKQSDEDVEPTDSDEVATGQRVQLASSWKNPKLQMHSVAPTLFVMEPLQSALLQLSQRLSPTTGMIESTGQISKQELPSGEVKSVDGHSSQDV